MTLGVELVERLESVERNAGGRISRALVLDSPPDANAGEITDKGYIAQSLARSRRAEAVERLFSDPVSFDVMVF